VLLVRITLWLRVEVVVQVEVAVEADFFLVRRLL
jgi:hypothetical protein